MAGTQIISVTQTQTQTDVHRMVTQEMEIRRGMDLMGVIQGMVLMRVTLETVILILEALMGETQEMEIGIRMMVIHRMVMEMGLMVT
jgi:hypothetical protein